jgi:hypothetical protein
VEIVSVDGIGAGQGQSDGSGQGEEREVHREGGWLIELEEV